MVEVRKLYGLKFPVFLSYVHAIINKTLNDSMVFFVTMRIQQLPMHKTRQHMHAHIGKYKFQEHFGYAFNIIDREGLKDNGHLCAHIHTRQTPKI